jgi:hypothetical protein
MALNLAQPADALRVAQGFWPSAGRVHPASSRLVLRCLVAIPVAG